MGIEVDVENEKDYWSPCYYIDPFQGGKYHTYRFTGNLNQDNQVMLNARNKIDELISKNNTIEKVKFTWNDSIKYSRYIEIIDHLENSKGIVIIYQDSIKYIYDEGVTESAKRDFKLEQEFVAKVMEQEFNIVDERANENMLLMKELIGNYKYLLFGSFILLLFFTFKNRR